jgi:hypothetical protein
MRVDDSDLMLRMIPQRIEVSVMLRSWTIR